MAQTLARAEGMPPSRIVRAPDRFEALTPAEVEAAAPAIANALAQVLDLDAREMT